MTAETIMWIIILVLFLLAYAGLVVPVLPDYPFALGGFAIYHFFINNGDLGWFFWITALIMAVLLFVVDYIASGIAVKNKGGSRWGIVAAFVGILVFPIFLGPLGIIIGPFVMVVMVEYAQKKKLNEAMEIGYSTLIGFIGGIFVKFLVITGMICWFIILHFL